METSFPVVSQWASHGRSSPPTTHTHTHTHTFTHTRKHTKHTSLNTSPPVSFSAVASSILSMLRCTHTHTHTHTQAVPNTLMQRDPHCIHNTHTHTHTHTEHTFTAFEWRKTPLFTRRCLKARVLSPSGTRQATVAQSVLGERGWCVI